MIDDLTHTLLEKYVIRGGPLMWVLVPCSVVMLGAVLQAMIALRLGRVAPRQILATARAIGDGGDRASWLERLRRRRQPLARIVTRLFHPTQADIARSLRERIDEAIADASDAMRDGLIVISTIYTVAPLLGLLGTILGMMDTFQRFANAEQRSVGMLSIGIQEALVTTMWGLAIAIPAYVAHEWLHHRINRYERELLPERVAEVLEAIGEPEGES